MSAKRQLTVHTKQSRGLVRALDRIGVRNDKSPQVVRKVRAPHEPTICARCGAVFLRKTWRHNHALSEEQLELVEWGFCPACLQIAKEEGQGRLVIHGEEAARNEQAIRQRINNVAARAAKTQPERRIVDISSKNGALEVLTTSQKLSHRLAHELKKAFGGRVAYTWSDDGSLFATWDSDARQRTPKKKGSTPAQAARVRRVYQHCNSKREFFRVSPDGLACENRKP